MDPSLRDREEQIVVDKIINEGRLLHLRYIILQGLTLHAHDRVQDLEEECPISLRPDPEVCSNPNTNTEHSY